MIKLKIFMGCKNFILNVGKKEQEYAIIKK